MPVYGTCSGCGRRVHVTASSLPAPRCQACRERTCLQCGGAFETRNAVSRAFCSHKCSRSYWSVFRARAKAAAS